MATREQAVAGTLIHLADTLVSDYDLIDYLDVLLARSVVVLEADAGAVLLRGSEGAFEPLVSTDERARVMELLQLQRQEGPCVDCYRQGQQIFEEDLTNSSRWPQFAPVALDRGFHSVFAFPLRLRGEVLGALNLFRERPGPVSGEDISATQAFADMATIGILQERAVRQAQELAEQLQTALNSRVVIEQAKGVLAERADLDIGDAFLALRHYARHHNRRLSEVAAEVIANRLPADEITRRLR